jgi:Holliday junction resolvasome RuvABC endonuclease subunit
MTFMRSDDTLAQRLQQLSRKLEKVIQDAKSLATAVNGQVEPTAKSQRSVT